MTITCIDKFQFHKGTIRTSLALHKYHAYDAFQFHKGTIRTNNTAIINHGALFQFHKGTIRTLILILVICVKYISIP